MASDSDSAAAFLERLINSRNRDLSFLLPLILGFSNSSRRESDDSDREEESDRSRGRIVLINPLTQGMIVIESSRSLEDLIREFTSKEGPKPASKASIEAIPKVVITEEDQDKECSICLDGWEIGGEASEMPCKHRYHSNCIEKWLEMHGSCPVCRHMMPVDEEEENKKSSGGEEQRGRGEFWVSFAFNGRRASTDSNDDDGSSNNEEDS